MTVSEISLIVLKILLALYILSSLLKFCVHFFVQYETRIKKIEGNYGQSGRKLKLFDNITLAVAIVLVLLLFISGEMEYLSFTNGFVVGMTVLQIYFHRFREPLPPNKALDLQSSPIKYISYAIQEKPGRAWREYLIMAVLLVWSLYMLLKDLF